MWLCSSSSIQFLRIIVVFLVFYSSQMELFCSFWYSENTLTFASNLAYKRLGAKNMQERQLHCNQAVVGVALGANLKSISFEFDPAYNYSCHIIHHGRANLKRVLNGLKTKLVYNWTRPRPNGRCPCSNFFNLRFC